jgi:hypothetical protein
MKCARCQHENAAGMEQLAAQGGFRHTAEALHLEQADAITIASAVGA